MSDEPRCPVCGYTEEDMAIQGDHHLCSGPGPAAHLAPDANPARGEQDTGAEQGEPRDPILASFEQAVHMAYEAGAFKEFCRLYGYPMPRSGIDGMVDRATGLEEQRYREFIRFVRKYIWEPCLTQMLREDGCVPGADANSRAKS